MKKLTNPAPPLAMATLRAPLTVKLSIEIVGAGTLTQSQDSTRNLWQPNRTTSPLVLRPKFEAMDSEKGTKVTVNASYTWYVGDIVDSWTAATETGRVTVLGGAGNDEYYLETNNNTSSGTPTGRLVVRKNVDHQSARKILLEASYTDSSRSGIRKEYAEVVLSSENRPDEFLTVKLSCATSVKFNPLTDASSLRTIKAVARLGKNDVSASRKFFWKADGVLIATDGSFPGYASSNQPSGKGQGTDTIVLDMDSLDGVTLSVGVGESLSSASPLADVEDRCNLVWEWPRLELMPHSKGARLIREDDSKKDFVSILKADGIDVDASRRAEYLRQQWWVRPTDTGVKSLLEWGEETSISASLLKKTGDVNVDVSADLYLLSTMDILTEDDGVTPITDDSGAASASSYGGLVVGRC